MRRVLASADQNPRLWFVVTVVTGAAFAGGLAFRQHHRYKHCAIHEPGKMYRCAWVEPDVMRELIKEYEIRSVVDLCRPGEMGEPRWVAERHAVADCGARLLELSMPQTLDSAGPQLRPHIEALSNPENFPMLVHCQHGVTRTAKFLVLYDVLFRGIPADDSLRSMPRFGREDHNVHVRAFARQLQNTCDRLAGARAAGNRSNVRR